jgi:phytoene desaturase
MTRIAVLGAGLGGLAAAIRLRARGHEVDVYERLQEPGGRARTFHYEGIAFDAGPTVITAPFLLDELFALAGRLREDEIDLLPVKPWYRYLLPEGDAFDYGSSAEEVVDAVARFSPQDREGYLRLRAYAAALYREGYERRGDTPFDTWGSMLRALPALLRLRADRSVHAAVSHYVRDRRLREILSVHPLLVGGHPFRTSAIYALIVHLEQAAGVWYVRGGTGALVTALERAARGIGVRFHYAMTVRRLHAPSGRIETVEFENGSRIAPQAVVSNLDPATLYGRLLDAPTRRRWTRRKLSKQRHSMGLYVLYFATDGEYPDVAHHSIVLDAEYRRQLDDIFDGDGLPPRFSAYLHRPKATDPEAGPAGVDPFYVLVPVPNLRASIDWTMAEPAFRERVLDFLERRALPGLRARLRFAHAITPRYFADTLMSAHGSGFSIHPDLLQSAYFRFHNRSEECANLYLVGAGTHPGAGVPGVLTSAKLLDRLIPAAEQGATLAAAPSPSTGSPQGNAGDAAV